LLTITAAVSEAMSGEPHLQRHKQGTASIPMFDNRAAVYLAQQTGGNSQ